MNDQVAPATAPARAARPASSARRPAAAGGAARRVGRRRWRRTVVVLLTVSALLVALSVTAVVGHRFAVDERAVTIPTSRGDLQGVLAMPPDARGPVGIVVFVHGDGPVDATSDGFYRPIWEALARAGYASLSWSKPGVGGSEGDWLAQSLHDRAVEAGEAVDWVRAQPGIDPDRVGLWGASQGGWVLPEVATARDDVRFVIAVSPAVSWLRQGRYNLLAELDHADAGPEERRQAVEASDRTRELLAAGASYDEYRAAARRDGEEPMTRDRWGFVLRNHTADATADLARLGQRDVPVLLLLGEEDRNVDVDETQAAYAAALGDHLTVRRFAGAAHTLARTWIDDEPVLGTPTALLLPRRVFVPGYLDAQTDFLAALPRA